MSQLTDHGRRVLAHLPIWVEDETAHVDAEGGPDISIRSYNLQDFAARLAEDPFTLVEPDGERRPLTVDECEQSLDALVTAKLATKKNGEYRMTRRGRDALQAPVDQAQQTPGAVIVDVAPAALDSGAHS